MNEKLIDLIREGEHQTAYELLLRLHRSTPVTAEWTIDYETVSGLKMMRDRVTGQTLWETKEPGRELLLGRPVHQVPGRHLSIAKPEGS